MITKERKKLHLVKWEALQRKKKHGGLGIKNLKKMNEVCLQNGCGGLLQRMMFYGRI